VFLIRSFLHIEKTELYLFLELWKGSSRKGAVEVLEFGFDDLRD
jgi:hypothetical protein